MGQDHSDQGMSSPKRLDVGKQKQKHDHLKDKEKASVLGAESEG